MSTHTPLALGLDAGGTTTRWLLVDAHNTTLASGHVAGLSGLHLNNELGVRRLRKELAQIAADISTLRTKHSLASQRGETSLSVLGGFTGIDAHSPELASLIAEAFAIDANAVRVMSDIELAYHGAFSPGAGYLVYAGTGSIAAFIDHTGAFHRAGGRGVGLDDGGGGYWMAREALRHIWRREDEAPGAWKSSPLAVSLFEKLGGSDWDRSRGFFYSKERGEIGRLALAVKDTADADPVSREILRGAGIELSRLANAMIARFGVRPVSLAGRAASLHPIIEATFRERVRYTSIAFVETEAERVAARLAVARMTRTAALKT